MAEATMQRRKTDDDIQEIRTRLDAGEVRMGGIESAIRANTVLTQTIADSVKGIVAFSDDIAGGARFVCRIAKGAIFVTEKIIKPLWLPALICYLSVYFVTHGFTLPDWAIKFFAGMLRE